MKTYKIVKVDWVDSANWYGWRDNKYRETNSPSKCMSCGILIKTKKGSIGVTHSIESEGDTADTMVIPRCAIRKIEVLSKVKI